MMVLELDGQGPRYAQIARALSSLIHGGALAPGARVPPTRELARDLSCSRNIVLLAYEQLTIEGYLHSRGGGGTFVSPDLPGSSTRPAHRAASSPRRAKPAIKLSPQGQRIADAATQSLARYARLAPVDADFIYGLSVPDARMVEALRRAFAKVLRRGAFAYPPPAGDEQLRQQLVFRLRTARGITCDSAQLLITSGTQQALELCTRLLVAQGDRVIVEDPTYDGVQSLLAAAGAKIIRVPVDRHGLVVSALPEGGPPVRLVYVTPSHHFPTGATMPASRRYALLAWARRTGALIFEDDYDSEFRFGGRPIQALAAIDPGGPVIYCGTFAKSLFPALRLGYLSLPPELLAPARGCKWLSDRGSPLLLQCLVAELMANGDYDRHIRRMVRQYRARRNALVDALQRKFGADVTVEGDSAGLHLVARLRQLPHDSLDLFIQRCRERGIGIYSAAAGPAVHAHARTASAGLLLGYGLLDVDRIRLGVAIMAGVYREMVPGNAPRGPRQRPPARRSSA